MTLGLNNFFLAMLFLFQGSILAREIINREGSVQERRHNQPVVKEAVNLRESCRHEVVIPFENLSHRQQYLKDSLYRINTQLSDLRPKQKDLQKKTDHDRKNFESDKLNPDLEKKAFESKSMLDIVDSQITSLESQKKSQDKEFAENAPKLKNSDKLLKQVFNIHVGMEFKAQCPPTRSLCPLPNADQKIIRKYFKELGLDLPEACQKYFNWK